MRRINIIYVRRCATCRSLVAMLSTKSGKLKFLSLYLPQCLCLIPIRIYAQIQPKALQHLTRRVCTNRVYHHTLIQTLNMLSIVLRGRHCKQWQTVTDNDRQSMLSLLANELQRIFPFAARCHQIHQFLSSLGMVCSAKCSPKFAVLFHGTLLIVHRRRHIVKTRWCCR